MYSIDKGWQIVKPQDAIPSEDYAAEELQKFFDEISGSKVRKCFWNSNTVKAGQLLRFLQNKALELLFIICRKLF